MKNRMKLLSIREVSRRTGLAKHTLRFWEHEMDGILAPLRTKGRQRRYAAEHLSVIEEIKKLKADGLTLDDIRNEMHGRSRRQEKTGSDPDRIDLLADRIAEAVKSVIYSFFEGERGS